MSATLILLGYVDFDQINLTYFHKIQNFILDSLSLNAEIAIAHAK